MSRTGRKQDSESLEDLLKALEPDTVIKQEDSKLSTSELEDLIANLDNVIEKPRPVVHAPVGGDDLEDLLKELEQSDGGNRPVSSQQTQYNNSSKSYSHSTPQKKDDGFDSGIIRINYLFFFFFFFCKLFLKNKQKKKLISKCTS